MRIFLILYLFTLTGSSLVFAQDSTNVIDNKKWLTPEKYRESFIKKIAQELNSWKEGDSLPSFLYKVDFDSRHGGYWWTLHTPLSLRKMIFDLVDNEKILLEIIRNKNIFDKTSDIPIQDFVPPFSDYSNYELSKYRLEEIYNMKPTYIGNR